MSLNKLWEMVKDMGSQRVGHNWVAKQQPFRSPPEHWVEVPVPYRFSLVMYFLHSSVYMSVPVSKFIPPSFPTLVPVHLFSTSVSLFLLCKQVHLYHFSKFYIYELIHNTWFSLSDLLLYDSLCIHPLLWKWHSFVPFCDWVIFHCLCIPHLLYPFVCWCTFRWQNADSWAIPQRFWFNWPSNGPGH